ncbi:MAG TPA: hypothetical protein VHX68_05740 [Planctomycetaceae bacterium]|nr:hypothetical protein [Planctomycetaceae bacterium]
MIGWRHRAGTKHLSRALPGLAISDRRGKILERLKVDLPFVRLLSVTLDAVPAQKGLNSVAVGVGRLTINKSRTRLRDRTSSLNRVGLRRRLDSVRQRIWGRRFAFGRDSGKEHKLNDHARRKSQREQAAFLAAGGRAARRGNNRHKPIFMRFPANGNPAIVNRSEIEASDGRPATVRDFIPNDGLLKPYLTPQERHP